MLRENTSKLLSNKILTLFLTEVLLWPKRQYTEIVVDFFNNPIGVLDKKSRLYFFTKYEQNQILKFFNMSRRKRKEYIKDLIKKAEEENK